MISPHPTPHPIHCLPTVIHCMIAPEGMIRTGMTRFLRVDHRHCRALYEHPFPTVNSLWVQRSSVDACFTPTNDSNSQYFSYCSKLSFSRSTAYFSHSTCCGCNVLQWMHALPVQTTATANIVRTAASCLFQGVQHILHTSLAAGATFFSGCTLYPYKRQQQFTCCGCNVLQWMHALPLQMTATVHLLWVKRSSVDACFTLTNDSNSSLAVGATFFSGCMIYLYKRQQQAIFFVLQQVVFFKEHSIVSTVHLLLMQSVLRRIFFIPTNNKRANVVTLIRGPFRRAQSPPLHIAACECSLDTCDGRSERFLLFQKYKPSRRAQLHEKVLNHTQ